MQTISNPNELINETKEYLALENNRTREVYGQLLTNVEECSKRIKSAEWPYYERALSEKPVLLLNEITKQKNGLIVKTGLLFEKEIQKNIQAFESNYLLLQSDIQKDTHLSLKDKKYLTQITEQENINKVLSFIINFDHNDYIPNNQKLKLLEPLSPLMTILFKDKEFSQLRKKYNTYCYDGKINHFIEKFTKPSTPKIKKDKETSKPSKPKA